MKTSDNLQAVIRYAILFTPAPAATNKPAAAD